MGNLKKIPGYQVVDQDGELGQLFAIYPEEDIENYTVRRLKMTVWQEGYLWSIEHSCKSQKDITLFKKITNLAEGKENMIFIRSISQFAKDNNVSRIKIYDFLKRLEDIGFLYKIATGAYQMNPFVVLCNATYMQPAKSKAILQSQWHHKVGTPPDTDELDRATTLRTKEKNECKN